MPPPLVHYVSDESDYDSDDSNSPRVVTDAVEIQEDKGKRRDLICKHKHCKRYKESFPTASQLRAHKTANKDTHNYCATCDEDFEDYDQLTLHHLNSDKHMTCCVCLKEFKSEGGLQLHMKQAHRQRNETKCPSCGEKFPTTSGLLQHAEGNLCAGGFRRSDIYKRILESQDAMSNLRLDNVTEADSSSESMSPPLKPVLTTPVSNAPISKAPVINSPAANAPAPAPVKAQPAPSPSGSVVGKERPRVRLVDVRDKGEEIHDEHIEISDEWYDPQKKAWCCPFKPCKKSFPHLLSFEQHINSSTHQAKNFRCPGCMSRFSSSSALLQHVEAGQCRLGAKAYTTISNAVQEEFARTGAGNSR